MAKTSGALFSTDARGSVGALTYQHTYRRKIVRAKPIPLNRRSPAQLIVRAAHAKSIKAWQDLCDTKKLAWKEHIAPDGNRGYHAFIGYYAYRTLRTLWQWELPPSQGYCTVGNHLVGDFAVGGEFQT